MKYIGEDFEQFLDLSETFLGVFDGAMTEGGQASWRLLTYLGGWVF
jgi:hypothetical protein